MPSVAVRRFALLAFLTLLITYAIDPLEAKKSIRIQQGQNDFDFLSALAKENGWEMFIDHSLEPHGYVLRFNFLIQDYAPSLSLDWGSSLLEFTPKLTYFARSTLSHARSCTNV